MAKLAFERWAIRGASTEHHETVARPYSSQLGSHLAASAWLRLVGAVANAQTAVIRGANSIVSPVLDRGPRFGGSLWPQQIFLR